MNLRQKAKRYKKLYNSLKEYTVPCTITTVDYATLAVQERIPRRQIAYGMEPIELKKESIGIKLAKEIIPYVTFETYYEPSTDTYVLYAKLRVVKY